MASKKDEYPSEIFPFAQRRRELLKPRPYTPEDVTKDEEISTRIRWLCDQVCVGE